MKKSNFFCFVIYKFFLIISIILFSINSQATSMEEYKKLGFESEHHAKMFMKIVKKIWKDEDPLKLAKEYMELGSFSFNDIRGFLDAKIKPGEVKKYVDVGVKDAFSIQIFYQD